jgi:hypothetical protein
MGARETYQAAVIAAEKAKIAAFQAATVSHQVAVNAASVDAGINPARGVADGSALDAAVRNANAAYATARLAAEMAKQVTVQAAKDVLRNSGDNAPA